MPKVVQSQHLTQEVWLPRPYSPPCNVGVRGSGKAPGLGFGLGLAGAEALHPPERCMLDPSHGDVVLTEEGKEGNVSS